MIKTFKNIPKVIFQRFPHIMAYIIAAYAVIFIGQVAYYRFMPGEHFLNYSKFHVNTVEEHSDVPFEACKKTDYPYKIVGQRKIFRIPEGKTEIDKVLVKQYPLDSIITKTPCVNAFISKEQYDFTKGNYQIYTVFNFKTKFGNDKSVTFKSNVFSVISARPVTVEDIQARIDELQREIDLLKLQLQAAREGVPVNQRALNTTSNINDEPPSATEAQQPTEPPTTTPVNEGLLPDDIPVLGWL